MYLFVCALYNMKFWVTQKSEWTAEAGGGFRVLHKRVQGVRDRQQLANQVAFFHFVHLS